MQPKRAVKSVKQVHIYCTESGKQNKVIVKRQAGTEKAGN